MRQFPLRTAVRVLGGGLLVLIVTTQARPQSGPVASPPVAAAVERFIDSERRLSRIPGVGISIVRRDDRVLDAGFGHADADGRPVSPETPFVLGSVSKTLTALAVAQLVDAGRIRFDDPVRRSLPDLSLREAAEQRITVRHLLTHTSGLSQWSGHDLEAQRFARFDHIRPVRAPGVAFEYSSLNYIILGQVIEAASGTGYGEYLRRHVFEPLEMRSSFVDIAAARDEGLARGARYLFGFAAWSDEPLHPAPLVPAGFLVASARDLGNFLSMLLGEGTFRGKRVVSAESVKAMLTPWSGGETGPAMAWGVGPSRVGHAGNARGFSARVALLRSQGYGIAILTNVNSGPFFAGSAALMDGTVRVLNGDTRKASRPDELLFKAALLASVLWSLGRLLLAARRWIRRGSPLRLPRERRRLARLGLEILLCATVMIAFPRWIGVPFRVLLEFFPDLGLAMVVGAGSGLSRAVLQAFLAGPGSDSGSSAVAARVV
jgi:CubicO group peptidase (beta-lactamase class C family)